MIKRTFIKRTLQLENITLLQPAIERALAIKAIQKNSFPRQNYKFTDDNSGQSRCGRIEIINNASGDWDRKNLSVMTEQMRLRAAIKKHNQRVRRVRRGQIRKVKSASVGNAKR